MRKCHKVVLYYVSVSINLGAVLCMYKLGLFIEDQKLQCYKKNAGAMYPNKNANKLLWSII